MTNVPAFDPTVYATPALAEANRVHHEAYWAFRPVEEAYRAGTATDEEYFAARRIYEAARDLSDAMEFAAVETMEDEDADEVDDGQLSLI